MGEPTPDAIVIGAGPNGLVAANLLADAGWSVLVLEGAPRPGGAVQSDEVTKPGFRHDLFSAFYPLTMASVPMREMQLERYGVEWLRAEHVVAHPARDGTCAVLSQHPDRTIASFDPGVGEEAGWMELIGLFDRVGDAFMEGLMSPFPPWRAGLRIARELGLRRVEDFARLGTLSVRRLADEQFSGEVARRLVAGNALHADLTPEASGGGLFSWVLIGLGHRYGFPFPRGGAQSITDALVRRFRARGGHIECNQSVTKVIVRGGRARAVHTAPGERLEASRAIIATTGAPALYRDLVGEEHLPRRLLRALDRFQYDNATVKVDWSLSGPIPWVAADAHRSAVVHVAESLDELTLQSAKMSCGLLPDQPFLVLGQYAAVDSTRQPDGCETAWAYTHVPQGARGDAAAEIGIEWSDDDARRFADRMERRVEELAPGFRERILARHIATPVSLEAGNPNLVGGAINGGTAQIHQQVIFRPTPGLARPATPIPQLYLGSASAHPGGGVHGACGANAARAAIRQDRLRIFSRAMTRSR